MKFSQLLAVPVPAFLPKALRKEIEALNQRIERHRGYRENVKEAIAKAQNSDPLAVDAVDEISVRQTQSLVAQHLQEELQIREAIGEILPKFYEALSEEVQQAFERAEAAKAAIRKQLVALGYHDVPNHILDPHKIQQGWILAHPSVRAAADEHQSLRSQSAGRDLLTANERAANEVRRQLAEMRRQALAGLPA